MSKDLIVRLREAAAQRVASTAMIGADDLIAAADALEIATAGMNAYCDELGSCRKAAGFGSADDPMAQEGFGAFSDPLCVAAFVESQFKRIVAERDALAAELKAVRGDQTPTVEDINLQEWKGMDGACAWHLIDRYAEDWHHTARLMNAWLEANRQDLVAQVAQLSAAVRDAFEFAYQAQKELKALREQKPVAWGDEPWMASFGVRVGRDSSNSIDLIFTTVGRRKFQLYANEAAYLRGLLNKAEIPGYPNTHPVPARELTDEEILNALDGKVGTQFLTTPVTCKEFWLTAGSVDVREFVRAIEAAIKGEGK